MNFSNMTFISGKQIFIVFVFVIVGGVVSGRTAFAQSTSSITIDGSFGDWYETANNINCVNDQLGARDAYEAKKYYEAPGGGFNRRDWHHTDLNRQCMTSTRTHLQLLQTFYREFNTPYNWDTYDDQRGCTHINVNPASGGIDYMVCADEYLRYCKLACTDLQTLTMKLFSCNGTSDTQCNSPRTIKTYPASSSARAQSWLENGSLKGKMTFLVYSGTQLVTYFDDHIEMSVPYSDLGLRTGNTVCIDTVSYSWNTYTPVRDRINNTGEQTCHVLGSTSFYTLNTSSITPPPTTPPPTVTKTPTPTSTPPSQSSCTLFTDNFAANKGWRINPFGSDTASRGLWERGTAQGTSYQGVPYQLASSGVLVTGALAGSGIGAYDIDGGVTTAASPNITIPAGARNVRLTFDYYFAHYSNATQDDYFRVEVVAANGRRSVLFTKPGASSVMGGAWSSRSVDLSAYAGQTIRLLVAAADGGGGSLVDAAFDNVVVRGQCQGGGTQPTNTPAPIPTSTPRPPASCQTISDSFEGSMRWRINPRGTDSATNGLWERGAPKQTTHGGVTYQVGQAAHGSQALITGSSAGTSVGAFDLDSGLTSVQSPAYRLGNVKTLSFKYYLAHYTSDKADYLRVTISGGGRSVVLLEVFGQAAQRAAAWRSFSADISQFAGKTVTILVEAADGGGGSIIEAGFDDLKIGCSG